MSTNTDKSIRYLPEGERNVKVNRYDCYFPSRLDNKFRYCGCTEIKFKI